MVKDRQEPSVRVNMELKGTHARVLQDMMERGIVTSYPEGIRLVLTKYLEVIDSSVIVVRFEGMKKIGN